MSFQTLICAGLVLAAGLFEVAGPLVRYELTNDAATTIVKRADSGHPAQTELGLGQVIHALRMGEPKTTERN